MKRKLWIIIFLFSLTFNVVFILDLLSERHSNIDSVSGDKLNLTIIQKKRITEESLPIVNENKKLESELRVCNQDLYDMLNADKVDKKTVRECISKINEIQKNIQLNTIEQLLIYKKHMTPEQCKCFLEEFGSKLNLNHNCTDGCNCSE